MLRFIFHNRILYFGLIVILLAPFGVNAQIDSIFLRNPSLEGIPSAGLSGTPFPLDGWYDCGNHFFPNETPPDIHPNLRSPSFDVTKPAQHGNTYVGLVVRDNDTWEAISQRLSNPLQSGNCYEIKMYLARSENYSSQAGNRDSNVPNQRNPDQVLNHNTPSILRIWGGKGYCDKKELLAETSEVIHNRWIEYTFKLKPTALVSYLSFEVFYKLPALFPTNGNLLIDNISTIVKIPCEQPTPEIVFNIPKKANSTTDEAYYTFNATALHVDEKSQLTITFNGKVVKDFIFDSRTKRLITRQRLKDGENTLEIVAENTIGKSNQNRTVTFEKEKTVDEIVSVTPSNTPPTTKTKESTFLKRNELQKGRTIRIEKLYFPADSATIKKESYGALEEVFDFLNQNTDVIVEVGGHTNSVPPHEFCYKLSTSRAKAVALYLANKGIDSERLKYKGYGKTKPIATNKTMEGRRKNQRVEIKILSFDG